MDDVPRSRGGRRVDRPGPTSGLLRFWFLLVAGAALFGWVFWGLFL